MQPLILPISLFYISLIKDIKMKVVIYIVLVFFPILGCSQSNCNCEAELGFVINYYEKNLASFADNVNSNNQAEYEAFKQTLQEEAKIQETQSDCFRILSYYVEFFKDNHASISMHSVNIDEENEEEVEAFLNADLYQNREMYELTEADLQQYPLEDIRGVYTFGDVYKIAIIPNKTAFRDYIGVILESGSKLWKRGQVKVEIKKISDNHYQAFSYLRNHSLRFSGRYQLKNGILGDTWVKTTQTDSYNYSGTDDNELGFRMLNDSIAYLRIPTFSGDKTAQIDSLYEVADATIREIPYLIIDIRNNGGGSDGNVSPLLPYIYTNPIETDQVDLLVTEDNLNLWRRWLAEQEADTINYGEEELGWIREEIAKMEQAEMNSFIVRSEGDKIKIKDIADSPKAIAIIQNQYCASSAETLIFWAKQSTKTILVGENSGGYVGYGENGGVNTPCFDFWLSCTMTRYKEQRKYEAEGIAPDYALAYNRDWIEQTIALLSQHPF